MGVPLSKKGGAPGGSQAARPVTDPGSTHEGSSMMVTGLTSRDRVTVCADRTGARRARAT